MFKINLNVLGDNGVDIYYLKVPNGIIFYLFHKFQLINNVNFITGNRRYNLRHVRMT